MLDTRLLNGGDDSAASAPHDVENAGLQLQNQPPMQEQLQVPQYDDFVSEPESYDDEEGIDWKLLFIKHQKPIGIGALVLVGVITLITLLTGHSSSESYVEPALSEQILGRMNPTADPCNDFYEYACGGWDYVLGPNETVAVASFAEIEERVYAGQLKTLKDNFEFVTPFYEACLDENDIEENGDAQLKPYFDLINSIDSVDKFWNVLGQMQRANLAKNSFLTNSVVVLNQVNRLAFDSAMPRIWTNLERYTDMLKLIDQTDLSKDKLEEDSLQLMVVFNDIAQVVNQANDDIRTFTKAELQHLNFSVDAYLSGLGDGSVLDQKSGLLDHVETVVWEGYNILPNIQLMLDDPKFGFDAYVWKNVLRISLVVSNLEFLPKKYLDAWGVDDYPGPITPMLRGEEQGADEVDTASLTADELFAYNWLQLSPREMAGKWLSLSKQQQALVWDKMSLIQKSVCTDVKLKARQAKRQQQRTPHPLFSHLQAVDLSEFYASKGIASSDPAVREQQCVELTVRAFGNFFAHDWVLDDFPEDNKAKATELVDLIHGEMENLIQGAKWLDEKTREAALLKWSLVAKNVAFDSEWDSAPDMKIQGHLFTDDASLYAEHKGRQFELVGDRIDRNRFPDMFGDDDEMTYFTANAFYYPEYNSINMLAGLMQEPMFSSHMPTLLNLAAYGFVIGHEITHGFDNNGRLYNGTGEMVDWWTDAATRAFLNQTQCLVDQYNGFEYYDMHVNGDQTLGENIADLGGLHNAWETFLKIEDRSPTLLRGHVSNRELFWVYAGQVWCQKDTRAHAERQLTSDPHSPGKFRIIGPMSNLKGFAETFKCKPTDVMGRSLTSDQCVVW